jgi:hypothetical protein
MREARKAAGGPLLDTEDGRLVMQRHADLDAWVEAQVREPATESRAS